MNRDEVSAILSWAVPCLVSYVNAAAEADLTKRTRPNKGVYSLPLRERVKMRGNTASAPLTSVLCHRSIGQNSGDSVSGNLSCHFEHDEKSLFRPKGICLRSPAFARDDNGLVETCDT